MKQLNWYQIFGKSNIPDGRTVLPTDDIQIWLNCANIWDKTYTTLAEVLADTDTLSALIASENAVDYMVRSTTWAVATALVPTMTSDTTPSGVVSSNSVRTNSNYPWNAFNGFDNGGGWCPVSAGNNLYIQYQFTEAKLINSVTVKSMNAALQSAVWSLKASNDGVTFTELTTVNEPNPNQTVSKSFGNTDTYSYYRLEGYFTNSGGGVKVQLYSPAITADSTAMTYIGLNNYASNTLLADATWCEAICNSEYFESVLNVKVPKMTDNTHPNGEVIYSGGAADAYKAFDRDTSTFWGAGTSTMPQYLGYIFDSSVPIYLMSVTNRTGSPIRAIKDFKLQSSSDNVTWNDEETFSNANDTALHKANYINTNSSTNNGWRVYITSAYDGNISMISELQFYGREDV